MAFNSLLVPGRDDTDVEVIVEERTFPLHSLILKTRSPFFEGVLTSGKGMKEGCGTKKENGSTNGTVELPGSAKVFEALLPFIYSESIGLIAGFTLTDLRNLFELANYLQLSKFEKHMGQREANDDHWGEKDKSPFESMKVCISEEMLQLEEKPQMLWLIEHCFVLKAGSVPLKPLVAALMETLRDHCRGSCHFVSAYMAMLLFGDRDDPDDNDLARAKNQTTGRLKQDLHFLKEMFEKMVEKADTQTRQTESAIQQLTLTGEVKALQAKLCNLEKEKDALQAKLTCIGQTARN